MLFLFSFLNGLHHGLGADHVLAITNLVNQNQGSRSVYWLGLRFGLGHMGVLMGLAFLALAWNVTVPPSWESGAEMFCGVLLIVLGLWTLMEWLRETGFIHSHSHSHRSKTHTHYHFHLRGEHPHRHTHPHVSTALGALFAFSGIRSVLLAAVPLMQVRSPFWVFLYIVIFGIGIAVSMAAFGLAFTSVLRTGRDMRWVSLLIALLSLGIGIYWVLSA